MEAGPQGVGKGEDELKLKAILGLSPKAEEPARSLIIKTCNRKKQKGVDLMLLQQGYFDLLPV